MAAWRVVLSIIATLATVKGGLRVTVTLEYHARYHLYGYILPKYGQNIRSFVFSISGEEDKSHLEEWNKIWGHHNTDYVNVLRYPESCMKVVKEQLENYPKAFNTIYNKYEAAARRAEQTTIIEECKLSPEKEAVLQNIDSEIENLLTKFDNSLKAQALHAIMKKNELKEMKREEKLIKTMLLCSSLK